MIADKVQNRQQWYPFAAAQGNNFKFSSGPLYLRLRLLPPHRAVRLCLTVKNSLELLEAPPPAFRGIASEKKIESTRTVRRSLTALCDGKATVQD